MKARRLPEDPRSGLVGRLLAAFASTALLTAALLSGQGGQSTAKTSSDEAERIFVDHLAPLMELRCLQCHNPAVKSSGLDLSSRQTLLQGGDRGPGLSPATPRQSFLYKVLTHEAEPGMPFQSPKLADEVLAEFAAWIEGGAPYTRTLEPRTAVAADEPPAKHWAYEPPVRPSVPAATASDGVNPVDAFLERARRREGLEAAPRADKRTLIRRVYLDLTGLPPSPDEVRAFLDDDTPLAYETVVDRLLSSPQYGERWGRHWMDVWRYSDWYGFRQANDVRGSARHIWQWRDWIIESLNDDKGYDQMVREMLAGDELAPNDPATLRATGYLARNWNRFNRNAWLQDVSEYTAGAFLGVTMRCARCHDHKYDPIKQEEYYKFRAFFEPYDVRTDPVPGEADLELAGLPRAFDNLPREAHLEPPFLAPIYADTFVFLRGDEQKPIGDPLQPALPEMIAGAEPLRIKPVKLDLSASYPASRPSAQRDLVALAKRNIAKAVEQHAKALDELEQAQNPEAAAASDPAEPEAPREPSDPAERLRKAERAALVAEKDLAVVRAQLPALEARIAADRAHFASPPAADADDLARRAEAAERRVALRKLDKSLALVTRDLDAAQSADDLLSKEAQATEARLRAELKAAQAAVEEKHGYTPAGTVYPSASTGRRTALAAWMTNDRNPLTARVAVNHVWLRHFGAPLVPTVNNFGMSGKAPTHPELLDWLAVEFMDSGWSMKHLHRLMVSSAAYQTVSSAPESSSNQKDPGNAWYWRQNAHRLEGEAIRDSILFVSEALDTAIGGPELAATMGDTSHRRSMYFQYAPDIKVDFLEVFDPADPNEAYSRTQSVVPQQALAIANSAFSRKYARKLARSLSEHAAAADDPTDFIGSLFQKTLGRPPNPEEGAQAEAFLFEQQARIRRFTPIDPPLAAGEAPSSAPWLRARESLAHVLINHNDFIVVR